MTPRPPARPRDRRTGPRRTGLARRGGGALRCPWRWGGWPWRDPSGGLGWAGEGGPRCLEAAGRAEAAGVEVVAVEHGPAGQVAHRGAVGGGAAGVEARVARVFHAQVEAYVVDDVRLRLD